MYVYMSLQRLYTEVSMGDTRCVEYGSACFMRYVTKCYRIVRICNNTKNQLGPTIYSAVTNKIFITGYYTAHMQNYIETRSHIKVTQSNLQRIGFLPAPSNIPGT
jgi:hypothetical protein